MACRIDKLRGRIGTCTQNCYHLSFTRHGDTGSRKPPGSTPTDSQGEWQALHLQVLPDRQDPGHKRIIAHVRTSLCDLPLDIMLDLLPRSFVRPAGAGCTLPPTQICSACQRQPIPLEAIRSATRMHRSSHCILWRHRRHSGVARGEGRTSSGSRPLSQCLLYGRRVRMESQILQVLTNIGAAQEYHVDVLVNHHLTHLLQGRLTCSI